jgi:hypothetical protein
MGAANRLEDYEPIQPGLPQVVGSGATQTFLFLPKNICGVELTESALMIPTESVSAIIGIGPKVEREAYECSVCDITDCFRRKE